MYKYISYIWLAVILLFVQIFLLDNISMAMWLRPMIFPLIVVLLPLEWRTIWVLLSALAVGIIMDSSLGGAGLYTATLLPLAVVRSTLLYMTTHRYVEHSDQTALLPRLDFRQLMFYIAVAFMLHHAMFFVMESLSFADLSQLLLRIIASTPLSIVIVWPITRLFMSKLSA